MKNKARDTNAVAGCKWPFVGICRDGSPRCWLLLMEKKPSESRQTKGTSERCCSENLPGTDERWSPGHHPAGSVPPAPTAQSRTTGCRAAAAVTAKATGLRTHRVKPRAPGNRKGQLPRSHRCASTPCCCGASCCASPQHCCSSRAGVSKRANCIGGQEDAFCE